MKEGKNKNSLGENTTAPYLKGKSDFEDLDRMASSVKKERSGNPVRRSRKFLFAKITVPFLIIVVVLGIWFLVSSRNEGRVTTITQSSLEKMLETNDLSTLEYTYNGITTVYTQDGKTPKYYVAYEGVVTAGIDITKINVHTDQDKKVITITIPDPSVQKVSVDMGSLDFIFEKKKYETETVSQEAYKKSMKDLKNKAEKEEQLLSMAKENAVSSIKALIEPWVKQLDDGYTVEVK